MGADAMELEARDPAHLDAHVVVQHEHLVGQLLNLVDLEPAVWKAERQHMTAPLESPARPNDAAIQPDELDIPVGMKVPALRFVAEDATIRRLANVHTVGPKTHRAAPSVDTLVAPLRLPPAPWQHLLWMVAAGREAERKHRYEADGRSQPHADTEPGAVLGRMRARHGGILRAKVVPNENTPISQDERRPSPTLMRFMSVNTDSCVLP